VDSFFLRLFFSAPAKSIFAAVALIEIGQIAEEISIAKFNSGQNNHFSDTPILGHIRHFIEIPVLITAFGTGIACGSSIATWIMTTRWVGRLLV
jgi:hypothetical protein